MEILGSVTSRGLHICNHLLVGTTALLFMPFLRAVTLSAVRLFGTYQFMFLANETSANETSQLFVWHQFVFLVNKTSANETKTGRT